MRIRSRYRAIRATIAALALCLLAAGAFVQSGSPTHPLGSINIHQVRIAFIRSGAMGGALYFRNRP